MLIYPAIDLRGGHVVRLRQGDYAQEQCYAQDPLALAQACAESGAQWLHVVDLDGARSGESANFGAIERIARKLPLRVHAGGGVRSEDDFRRFVDAGVARVVVGSLAVRDPALVRHLLWRYGADSLTLALDARADDSGVFRVAVAGWREQQGTPLDGLLAGYAAEGFRHFLVTDIACDGMLAGPNLALYRHLRALVPEAALLASGGVESLVDLTELAGLGMAGVVVGKALLEGRFTLAQALATGAG